MKIRVQSVHFTADQKLLDFIQKKADKTDTFFDKIVSAEVILKLDKSSEDMKNKVLEVKVMIPGMVLFAKENCKSFEEAADYAFESIQKQLQKYKGKSSEVTVNKEELFLDELAD
jgi:putative sigma-54 modulation protein